MPGVTASKDILVCAVEADLDDISLLHGVLAGAGWRARVIVVDAPSESHAQALRAAGLCIVAWSGASAQSQHLIELARHADALGILLPLQIDHAPHPLADRASIDIAHWREQPDQATRDALLRRIRDIAGPPPKPSSRNAPDAKVHSSEFRLHRAGVIVLALLALIALPAAMVMHGTRVRAAAMPERASVLDTAWRLVDQNDIAQLREFIALDPHGAEADRAREQLARVEASVWADVETAINDETRQRALETYLRAFPDGRFTARAKEDFDTRQKQIREAQARLIAWGYRPGAASGDMTAQTREAAALFQADFGHEPDGEIDEALLSALRAQPRAPRKTADASNPIR